MKLYIVTFWESEPDHDMWSWHDVPHFVGAFTTMANAHKAIRRLLKHNLERDGGSTYGFNASWHHRKARPGDFSIEIVDANESYLDLS